LRVTASGAVGPKPSATPVSPKKKSKGTVHGKAAPTPNTTQDRPTKAETSPTPCGRTAESELAARRASRTRLSGNLNYTVETGRKLKALYAQQSISWQSNAHIYIYTWINENAAE
jgi:hypothetical protein